jgi:Flp pilus assembly protein TadG
MMHTPYRGRRPGAIVVESAIIYPVAFLLLLGVIVGGLGMFRYQQVASLAREGCRWVSVRGGQYASETGHVAATAEDVRNEVIVPRAAGLDPSQLSCTVSWDADNWPSRVTGDNGSATGNKVRVTVSYRWLPEAYLGGITLSSTAEMPVAY